MSVEGGWWAGQRWLQREWLRTGNGRNGRDGCAILDAGDSRGICAPVVVASLQPAMRVGTLRGCGSDLDFFAVCALALTLAG